VIGRVESVVADYSRIGVAVSGGSDSVFLLTALHYLGRAAAVLHVNHQLRGAESDADEAFVRALAASHGLPFRSAILPPGEGNTEQQARRLRYEFFAECIADCLCDYVATGHTLDDQAETVLFRFLRGSGTAGLSGIRPETPQHVIRPLLQLRRKEIREYLTGRNIAWREDLSNADVDYQRNRIRLNVLPELTQLNPSLPQVLASTADWAWAEEDYWTAELDRLEPAFLSVAPETVLLEIEPLLGLPLAVQRRLLRRAVEHVRGNLRAIGFHHIEAIRALLGTKEGSGRIQLPDLDVFRSFDQLRLAPQHFDARLERNFCVPMQIPGETVIPERLLSIGMEQMVGRRVYNSDVNALDWAKCRGSLHLRNWRPGDQFQRVGKSGAETAVRLKFLFQEYRIPLWERRRWPVIVELDSAGGEKIVWTRRFGAAREFAATRESESVVLVNDRIPGNGLVPIESNQSGQTSNTVAPRAEEQAARASVRGKRERQ
jgi:tRNA(Ile)-lysidine synthase